MKTKRVVALLLCMGLTVGSIAGCGGGDTKETKAPETNGGSAETTANDAGGETAADDAGSAASDISGEITFVSGNDTTGTVQMMIDEFCKAYPNVSVDFQVLPGASDDVKKSLMTSLAAGDTDPDVFACDIAWVSQFGAAGWLMDVTEQIEARADEFLAGPLSTCYYDGKAYGYPDYTDVGLLYYRKDLVETPPTTWDELVSMSKEHIGKDGIESGFIFQMFQGEPTSCNMLEFIKQNGGADLADGKFAMNNSNTIEALEFVNSLIDDGVSPEGVLAHKPDDSLAIFQEGKALFMRNWTYAYARLEDAATSKVAGNVGVAALPVGPNGTESSGTLGGWNIAINVNTDAPEAAIAFAEFMTSFEMQKLETMNRSTFPTVAAVYDDAEVLEKIPYLGDVKPAADNAKPRPQVRDYSAISAIFQVYFHKALTGELSYEDAMAQMDTELNAALEKMQ